MSIPKIIHFCWYGQKEHPAFVDECINTWKKELPDYQIMCWDESNCSFDENEFIRVAYQNKKWAFVSDYYRLKALKEYGGIYLDTDVKVYRSLDSLLNYPAVLNFIFDCVVGSAVIAAEKNNKLISEFLDMYENVSFGKTTNGCKFQKEGKKIILADFETNNYFFTYHILEKYPDFKLNNKFQEFKEFVIFPKEYFETGTMMNKQYTIHHCTGSWYAKKTKSGLKEYIINLLNHENAVCMFINAIRRKIRYSKINKRVPFYKYQLAQERNERIELR